MKIDWTALGMVSVVSISASVLFMILLASSIRLLSPPKSGRIRVAPGQ